VDPNTGLSHQRRVSYPLRHHNPHPINHPIRPLKRRKKTGKFKPADTDSNFGQILNVLLEFAYGVDMITFFQPY